MVGILVHGNNHFILPDRCLTRQPRCRWCGTGPSSKLASEVVVFRAMADQVERVSREPGMGGIVPGDRETSSGVEQLVENFQLAG
jgi:hypothetical protein